MDGNGRWAKERGLIRQKGHEAGVERLKKITRNCVDLGIPYLTVFAFSTENWGRPKAEVDFLLKLFRIALKDYKAELIEKKVKVTFLGERHNLPLSILDLMEDLEESTREFKCLYLNIAFNYGSRKEIIEAAKVLLKEKESEIDLLGEEDFSSSLYTRGMPDVDLLIRPGGELRLSNFLLWQSAYAELYFLDTYWPDFDEDELAKALQEYNRRQRRFGKLKGD